MGRSRPGLGESFVVDAGKCQRNYSRVEVVSGAVVYLEACGVVLVFYFSLSM